MVETMVSIMLCVLCASVVNPKTFEFEWLTHKVFTKLKYIVVLGFTSGKKLWNLNYSL